MTEIVVDTDVISFGFRNDSRFTFYMPHMQGLAGTVSLRNETSRGSFRWGRFAMMPCQVSSEIQNREDPELW